MPIVIVWENVLFLPHVVAIATHSWLMYATLFPQTLDQRRLFHAVKESHIVEVIGFVKRVPCGCTDQQHLFLINGAIQYVLRTGGQGFTYQVSNH
jgi:hypothetical protein